jgi:3-oxoacyl-[acyl-carrier-protein] synthase-3
MERFGINEDFLKEKIGVRRIAVKEPHEKSSDLCLKAFDNLLKKIAIRREEIEILLVVTQNPDVAIPHTSAIVHGKLDMPETCACFDISLGCSGYVYGLSVILSMMRENGMKKGLIFTSDPYSEIIDFEDKNTSLIFGDAASVTYVSDAPDLTAGRFTFGTMGKEYRELILDEKGKLYMNGRAVYNFVAKTIPKDIHTLLEANQISAEEVDSFVFHQGSKKMIDTLAKRLALPPEKVVFDILDWGNTISSSIPIILEKEMRKPGMNRILISGFGVGLSWSGTILNKAGTLPRPR